jgi:hypothetical protein
MCYWLLPESGILIARTSIQAISPDKLTTDIIQVQLQNYDNKIENILNLRNAPEAPEHATIFKLYREDEETNKEKEEDIPMEPIESIKEYVEEDMYDQFLTAEPVLHTIGGDIHAKIIGHKCDQDGNLVGQYNSNPILNTRVYLAQFPDGSISEYATNIMAEAVYDQVNDDGHEDSLFTDIIGHEFNQATPYNESNYSQEDHLSQTDLIPGIKPSHTKNKKYSINYFKCKSLKRSYPLGASLHYLVLVD